MKRYRAGFRTLTFAGALLTSTLAVAGYKTDWQDLVVDTVDRLAKGDLATVRNSSDTTQVIFCQSYAAPGGSTGYCWAQGPTGGPVACYTTDPNLIAVIRSLNGNSYLYFDWDTNGHCTFIQTNESSDLPPKT
jgi:hypothetical protein